MPSKEDILEKLKQWFSQGTFITQKSIDANEQLHKVSVAESLCVKHQLCYTSLPKVYFVGRNPEHPTLREFQFLYYHQRIMTRLEAKIQMRVNSTHRLHKLVSEGELLRFDINEVSIYIR